MNKKELFLVVLVHTSRTWERMRLMQPHKEMDADNIESVDIIIEIANEIMNHNVIKGFKKNSEPDYFMNHTGELSDTFIELLAEDIIINNHL